MRHEGNEMVRIAIAVEKFNGHLPQEVRRLRPNIVRNNMGSHEKLNATMNAVNSQERNGNRAVKVAQWVSHSLAGQGAFPPEIRHTFHVFQYIDVN